MSDSSPYFRSPPISTASGVNRSGKLTWGLLNRPQGAATPEKRRSFCHPIIRRLSRRLSSSQTAAHTARLLIPQSLASRCRDPACAMMEECTLRSPQMSPSPNIIRGQGNMDRTNAAPDEPIHPPLLPRTLEAAGAGAPPASMYGAGERGENVKSAEPLAKSGNNYWCHAGK
ncbi:uncharacterized protein BDZ99DRAFT_525715 [Mytilinidion resinicola]|uniref:Uncharacterized protein n=1 Tax=Mytilinidion resinicola TaxID=574789 RepID=A0A6A6Y742_9PEZI|nr:uncharacterized protein BDZ99DRAFT_525715 [Mytilinidion resinicola]KAF2804510.1 hypothetical protein BDZ99DRAFT_525715 [Mytilinidion resinicola]